MFVSLYHHLIYILITGHIQAPSQAKSSNKKQLIKIHFISQAPLIYLYYHKCLICSSSLGPLCSINTLNILSLDKSSLVATKSPLCEFVNTLVSSRSSGFDHIKNTTLVRCKSAYFTGDLTTECGTLVKSLDFEVSKWGNILV
jgi:hypothetical protein